MASPWTHRPGVRRTWSDQFRRAAIAWLARRRGEEAAHQDFRSLVDVARFSMLFAATTLLPILLLAALAVSSIDAVGLLATQELERRAETTGSTLARQLEQVRRRFEAQVTARIEARQALTVDLRSLSPHLRAVFRRDRDDVLITPFERSAAITRADALQEPVAQVAQLRNAAVEAEVGHRTAEAATHWRTVAEVADGSWRVEALLGEARALARSGREREADAALAALYGDYGLERDPRGLRVGDLALLMRAELHFAREPSVGAQLLTDLVQDSLEAPWTIGGGGEPALARRAMRRLEGMTDVAWAERMRRRLDDRTDQLFWAGLVDAEIDALDAGDPTDGFAWIPARVDSPALWALLADGAGSWVFSFSSQSIFDQIREEADRLGAADPDLTTVVLRPGERIPDDALWTASAGTLLPSVTVAILPDDTSRLQEQDRRNRSSRLIAIAVSVAAFAAGLVLTALIVSREVEAARAKADFAANVSHELRSPITQIRLKGEALQLGLVEPGADTDAHHDAIVMESERLSRLVDNVLDFAAIERGAKRYTLRPDDLGALVRYHVEVASRDFETRGVRVEVDIADGLPLVACDRDAIGQVMTNLLSNAAKYGGDANWVGVRVTATAQSVDLQVADRGMGISADDLPHLFDQFFRSKDPRVRRRKGTGIGLAIVRYIVDAHGGTITVDSALGRGTTFAVSLPVAPLPRSS